MFSTATVDEQFYIPPEEIWGICENSVAGDIYSLCIIISELIEDTEFVKKAKTNPDAAFHRLGDKYPGLRSLLFVLKKGLSPVPSQRPSLKELQDSLSAARIMANEASEEVTLRNKDEQYRKNYAQVVKNEASGTGGSLAYVVDAKCGWSGIVTRSLLTSSTTTEYLPMLTLIDEVVQQLPRTNA